MMAAGAGLAVAVGVSGCGQVQQLSAKDTVSDALSNFQKAKSATFTVKLDATAADIAAIAKAQGDDMGADDTSVLSQVLAGDVVISAEAPDGKTFGDSSGSSFGAGSDLQSLLSDPQKLGEALKQQGSSSFTVRLSGNALVDVRNVDGLIYAKADVKKIVSLAGQDPSLVDAQLAQLPPQLAPLAKAARGEWVSIDLVKTAEAAQKQGLLDNLPTPTAVPTLDAAKLQRLMDSLGKAYDEKATITELGDSARGDGYRISAPAKQVAQAVSGDLVALIGAESEKEVRDAINEIPDKTFALDVWVKDDQLSGVALDLTQFLEKPVNGHKAALDIGVAVNSGAVTAPSGATELDLSALISQIPSGALSGGGASTLGGSTASGLGGGSAGAAAGGSGSSDAAGLDTPASSGSLSDAQVKELQKQTGLSEKEIRELMAGQK